MKKKKNLVLVSGWAIPKAVFHALEYQLEDWFNIVSFNVPGVIDSRHSWTNLKATIESFSLEILNQVEGPAIWLGWSLGGLVAYWVALNQPKAVTHCIAVATNPHFISEAIDSWPGIHPEIFNRFAKTLLDDYAGTVRRFIELQFFNSQEAVKHRHIERMRKLVFKQAELDPIALKQGLTVLQNTDLRAALAELSIPTLAIFGSHDAIAPASVAVRLPDVINTVVIEGATHMPFLTHEDRFLEELGRFLKEAVLA